MTATLEALSGLRIERVDAPARDVLAISLRRPDLKGVLLVRLSGPARGIGLVEQRPKGEPATGAVTKLRHHLVGAVIESCTARSRRALELNLSRTKRATCLRLVLGREQGNAIVLDGSRCLTSLHPVASHHMVEDEGAMDEDVHGAWPSDLDMLRRAGSTLTQAASPTQHDPHAPLRRAVKRRLGQLQRKLTAIRSDAARAAQADRLRHQANLLLTALHTVSPGQGEVRVADPSEGDRTVTLELERGRTPAQQADAWFQRARKLTRGARIAGERERTTLLEIGRAEELLQRLETAPADASSLRDMAETLGITPSAAVENRPKAQATTRRPFREFQSHAGARILVGRGAADNDSLTLHHSAPDDVWLHARGAAGAHVVIPTPRGKACPPEVLLDAALLAAHFSKFRDDSQVEVAHTRKRHVRKPKGSPPGLVRVDKEKVLLLRTDPERLRQLLESELKR